MLASASILLNVKDTKMAQNKLNPPNTDISLQEPRDKEASKVEIALPSEEYKIAPEALAVAQSYLIHQDLHKVAVDLDLPRSQVAWYLDKREVKNFVDSVFMQQGYMHRYKLQDLLTDVIDAKIEEMEETEMASTKDIADLIALQHKMRMDELNLQLKIQEKSNPTVREKVTNVQNNYGTNYMDLMEKISKV